MPIGYNSCEGVAIPKPKDDQKVMFILVYIALIILCYVESI